MLEPRDAYSYDCILQVLKNGFPLDSHLRAMDTNHLSKLASELASCQSILAAANLAKNKGARWISGGRIEVGLTSSFVKACVNKTGLWVASSGDLRQFSTCFLHCVWAKTRSKLATSGEMASEPLITPIVFKIHPTALTAQAWHIDLIHGRQFVMNITDGPATEVSAVPNTRGSLDSLCDAIGKSRFAAGTDLHEKVDAFLLDYGALLSDTRTSETIAFKNKQNEVK